MKEEWYKEYEDDNVWWLKRHSTVGDPIFSIDKQKKYRLFGDYPFKLSVEDWITFNRENEYWAEYFAEQNKEYRKRHKTAIEEYGV